MPAPPGSPPRTAPVGTAWVGWPPCVRSPPSSRSSLPRSNASGPSHAGASQTPSTRRATMESKAMVAVQESWPLSGASLPVGEPVTLVIEDERFFGWVAAASPAHSLVRVPIEFQRGGKRVQALVPVENIQRLSEYLQTHPELRQATEPGV